MSALRKNAEAIAARFDVVGFEPSTIPGIEVDWVGAVIIRKTLTEGLTDTLISHFVSSGTGAMGRR